MFLAKFLSRLIIEHIVCAIDNPAVYESGNLVGNYIVHMLISLITFRDRIILVIAGVLYHLEISGSVI